MKSDYSRKIALRCITCGSDSSFVQDKTTGTIRCLKCNRAYYGGETELKDLNSRLLDDTITEMVLEVKDDMSNEIMNMFKRAGFKVKKR